MKETSENHFIQNFKSRLETVKNKDYLIENEINQIRLFTSMESWHSDIPYEEAGLNFANETNSVFDLMDMGGSRVYFNSVFNEYLLEGTVTPILDFDGEADLSLDDELLPVEDDFLRDQRESAIAFAEYYLWLKELKIHPKSNQKFSSLNNDQKLLALHLLGLDLRDYTKTHMRKVLGAILNIGSENIRKNLSVLQGGKNNLRTKENFEKLLELFENKTFEPIQNKIKREIRDLD